MSHVGDQSTLPPGPQKRPRTRQRIHKPAPTLDVPDINDNAQERKRVLNVLAQRRYRQRNRQRKISCSRKDDEAHNNTCAEPSTSIPPSDEIPLAVEAGVIEEPENHVMTDSITLPPDCPAMLDFDISSIWSAGIPSPTIPDLLLTTSNVPASAASATYSAPSWSTPIPITTDQSFNIDPSILAGLPIDNISSHVSAEAAIPSALSLDSYLLPVHGLKLLQAFMRLAESLNCQDSFWDLTAKSPFNDTSIPLNPVVLTSSYAPTVAQKTIPHHPIIDFLPWPSVRDRLIAIFNLPDELKPPCAVGPLALIQLAHDMEDSAEGIRIWGPSCCSDSSK
ncbi:hypothetical protein AB5N19_10715 [Seiridium cardinale]|uniref:BZIP domain-containing protein n=1 Tax=Seiridium cardinale TaxID=138064 RepID=A0ABR2XSQ1_9PEZI